MNKSKRIIAALLSVCMLSVPAVASLSANAEDISSLEQQLDELDSKSQEYQDILDKTQSDINKKEAYSKALENKIAVLDNKIALTHQSIDELNNNISEKQAAIDKANADISGQIDTLCNRLRTIYMAGSASDLEIIFGAKDFSDLIDKVQLVKTLSSYDKELIDSLNEKLSEIAEQKASLEADKADVEEKENSLKADQDELNKLLDENQEILKNLYSTSADAEKALKNAALESEEIENKINDYYAAQKAAEEANKKSESPSSNNNDYDEPDSGTTSSPSVNPSGYIWPCPGFYDRSSEWNEDRGSYNHGAIDIAGGGIMGARVVAAADGIVISTNSSCIHNYGKDGYDCGCGGGYGNYVMIDHGNGKTAIYAHFSSTAVSEGQHVSQGQTIGYVGSTGYSTGPHLHFECRLYGEKYNPMNEF